MIKELVLMSALIVPSALSVSPVFDNFEDSTNQLMNYEECNISYWNSEASYRVNTISNSTCEYNQEHTLNGKNINGLSYITLEVNEYIFDYYKIGQIQMPCAMVEGIYTLNVLNYKGASGNIFISLYDDNMILQQTFTTQCPSLNEYISFEIQASSNNSYSYIGIGSNVVGSNDLDNITSLAVYLNNNVHSDAYNLGFDNGFYRGYLKGQQDAFALGSQNTNIISLFNTIASTPVTILSQFLNIPIFNTTLFNIFAGMISLLIVIWVTKKLL